MAMTLTHITDYLLNQSVQIALLVVVVAAVNLALRNKSAHVRYLLWLIVLAKCLVPPFLVMPLAILPPQEKAEPAPMSVPAEMRTPQHQADTARIEPSSLRPSTSPMPPLPTAQKARHRMTVHEWLGLGWAAGAVVFLIFNLLRALRANLWLWRRRMALTSEWQNNMANLFAGYGIKNFLKVWLVEGFSQPFVWGLWRGSIYLPVDFLDINRPEHQRSVLSHELSHVLRLDAAVNILQVITQGVFWFHPLVWWANRKIRAEREKCCDEMAIARLNTSPRDYGTAILETLAVKHKQTRPIPSLAVAGPVKNIEGRIKTMLRPGKKFYKHPSLPAAAMVLLVSLVAVPTTMVLTVRAANEPTTEHDTETAVATAPVSAPRPIYRKISIPGTWDAWDAQLSPDGKSMAFGRNGQLWIIPRVTGLGPDGPGAPQLVDTGGIGVGSIGVTWSADGQWMAFVGEDWVTTNDGSEENFQLYVVSAQGGKPRKVFEPHFSGIIWNRHISLSPDGKILAFASPEDRALRAYAQRALHVYTIPVEGGTPKRLVDVPAREPAFSPDGKWIAYVEDKNLGHGGGGLWVIPTEGGIARHVAETSNAGSPVWSPDGRMIAFVDYNLRDGIYIISLNENGAPVGAKITVEYPKEISYVLALTGWTPDNKIGVIFSRPFVGEGLYMLPLKGGPATLLTGGHCEGLTPHWSPDGKRIIHSYWVSQLAAGDEEADNGWLGYGTAWMPVEGGEATKIPVQTDPKMMRINWGGNAVSPDGKTIVFPGKAGERGSMTLHIWTLPIEGGRPTQLTHAPAPVADAYPCWSPDGKSIAFARCPDCTSPVKSFSADIFIVPAAGGEPRQVTSESEAAHAGVAWSPDGKLLAFFANDGPTLRVIPAEGGESRIVAKLQRLMMYQGLAWSPDSQRIAFDDPPNAIKIVSLGDGHIEDVDPGMVMTRISRVDWSRDGDKLVFGARLGGGEREFWLLENFLPAN